MATKQRNSVRRVKNSSYSYNQSEWYREDINDLLNLNKRTKGQA